VVIILLSGETAAQNKMSVSVNTIGLKQNLSSTNIHKIVEDKNGFLWFSTQDGLNKYDGINITKLTGNNIDNKLKLLGSDCFAMDYYTNDSLLYVSSSYEGINVININNNTVVNKISTSKITGNTEVTWIKRILRFKDYLIVATNNNKIFYIDTKTYKTKKEQTVLNAPMGALQSIFISNNELIVLLSQVGIIYYDLATLKLKKSLYFENLQLKKANINDAILVDNKMWIASSNGLFTIDINSEKVIEPLSLGYNISDKILNSYISTLCYSDSILYISNLENTYKYDLKEKNLTELYVNNDEQRKFLKAANCITKINDFIWLGGMYGVAQIKSFTPPFSPFYSDAYTNKKIEHVYSVIEEKGNILVASEDGFYNANIKNINFDRLLNNQSVYNFGKISSSKFLISSTKELIIYDGIKTYSALNKYPELKPIEKDLFISIQKINDSIILLASQLQTGLYVWNLKTHSLNTIEKKYNIKIEDAAINRIWQQNNDTTFIISETAIQLIENSKSKIILRKNNLLPQKADLFMDMCASKGNYWVAAYGLGIIKLNSKFEIEKTIGTNYGINNTGIYRIFNVGDSLIVASTNNGLSIYHIKKDRVFNYFEEDGLHSNVFEETSGFQTNNSIVMGGISGLTIFTPKNYKLNSTAPVLYFNTIFILSKNKNYDSSNLFIKEIEIPNDATQTKVSFVGLNFSNPARVRYWYKISGLQNDWVSLGIQNFVDLIGIQYGTYTLQVKAANEDGIECAPIELTLVFLPKWYQTWWFKVLLALSLIGIGFGLYKMRVAQIIKEQKIKNALASDLHDELGSSLTGLKMYAYQAKKNPEYMESLQEGITQSIKQVREMIWQLNEEKLTVYDLINKLAIIYKPLLKINNIELAIDIAANVSNIELNGKEKSHLYLILKEIINNALKYSQATELNIAVQKGKSRLLFTIADNGVGIQDERKGYGLKNIEQRAKEIKYSIGRISDSNGTIYNISK
jgi:two-component sensor histidine kinase/ligand-binding sensor domain-containing protein